MSLLLPDPNMVAARAFGNPVVQGPPRNFFQKLQDKLMPRPSSGLLSEEDVKNARMQGLLGIGSGLLAASGPKTADQRVGLMQAISQGIQGGQQAYSGAVDRSLEGHMGEKMFEQQQQKNALDAAASMQQLQAAQAAQQTAANRQKLFAENPPPADPAGYREWAKRMHHRAAAIGDLELAEQFKTILVTEGQQQGQKEPGTWVTVPGPDGRPMKRYVTASEGPVQEYQGSGAGGANLQRETLINPKTGKSEVALFNPKTGAFEFTGHTPTTSGAGSEAERKAQAIYELSAPHVAILDEADAPNRIEQLALNGKLNEALKANRQIWDVSGRQLADAYLRLTTGAAYNKEELEQATIMMVPRPGDTPAVIALKRANRARLVRALRAAAGRAYQETGPDTSGALGVVGGDQPNAFGAVSGGSSTAPSPGGYDSSLDSYWSE